MTADYSLGHEVIEWTERHLVFPRGAMRGQPLRWLPWQKRWIEELYRCDEDADLQYRWALLGVPKKNGKSVMLAALAVYHLLGDPYEVDPWAVVAATSDKQADVVFNDAKTMCELSPTLNPVTERFTREIRPKEGHGRLERVAASKGKLDGKDISFLAIDELHEWNAENWAILTNGTVGRERAQIVQITTAGYDLDTICGQEYEKGRAIEAGEVENPTYFFQWYSAPEDADYRAPATWKGCNPSYGHTVGPKVLADKLKNVGEAVFRRYFTNQWTGAASSWLPPGVWDGCESDEPLVPGAPTAIGWDASTKIDTTALCVVQDQDGRKVVRWWLWERPLLQEGSGDETWRLPIAEVEQRVEALCAEYQPVGVAYDPQFITWSADELDRRGLPMIEWPQTDSRMVPATQATYEAIINGHLAHDGNRVARRHVANVVAYQTRQGGQRVGKGRQRKAIDAAIAMVMGIGLLTGPTPEDKSPKAPHFWFGDEEDEKTAVATV